VDSENVVPVGREISAVLWCEFKHFQSSPRRARQLLLYAPPGLAGRVARGGLLFAGRAAVCAGLALFQVDPVGFGLVFVARELGGDLAHTGAHGVVHASAA